VVRVSWGGVLQDFVYLGDVLCCGGGVCDLVYLFDGGSDLL
jgi:hypothetical protein